MTTPTPTDAAGDSRTLRSGSMDAAAAHPCSVRLTELDWLRIAAFGLLIVYHLGMFYVPWSWHVKSPRPVPALEGWMLLSSPWRMSLLFVVSGAATGLALRRWGLALRQSPPAGSGPIQRRQPSVRGLLGERSKRLLLPLLFGMLVVVPPQPYLEAVDKFGYGGSYLQFLSLYYSADHSFCGPQGCLVLPTWNHLWFLPYLWLYTALLLGLLHWRGTAVLAAPGWRALTHGTRLLWLPCLLLALARQHLLLPFPSSNNLVWDWFNHALYGLMFTLGVGLFGQREDAHGAWAAAQRLRWWALAGGLLALAGMPRLLDALGGFEALPAWARPAWLALGSVRHWLPVVAALGFARHHLRERDGPWLRTLTDAVFPFYIVHQTLIVVAAHHLAKRQWPQALEAAVVLAVTVGGCAAVYAVARRVGWLQPWLGLAGSNKGHRPLAGTAAMAPRAARDRPATKPAASDES